MKGSQTEPVQGNMECDACIIKSVAYCLTSQYYLFIIYCVPVVCLFCTIAVSSIPPVGHVPLAPSVEHAVNYLLHSTSTCEDADIEFSSQVLWPYPKAWPRREHKVGHKRSTAVLTYSPGKQDLEEGRANKIRAKKATARNKKSQAKAWSQDSNAAQ